MSLIYPSCFGSLLGKMERQPTIKYPISRGKFDKFYPKRLLPWLQKLEFSGASG